MARFLRASVERSRELIKKPLTVVDYKRADKMMAWLAMKDTLEMMTQQDLSGLAPFWDGRVLYT